MRRPGRFGLFTLLQPSRGVFPGLAAGYHHPMIRIRGASIPVLLASLCFLLLASGCNDDGGTKPPPNGPTGIFWEARAYCIPAAAGIGRDTLFISNFEDKAFTWHPTHVPANSTNLDRDITIEPGTA